MKILKVILLSILMLNANDFTVKKIGEKESIFPYVLSNTKEKIGIARNINTYLHLEYLELLPDTYKKTPFEKINSDKEMPRLMVYSYKLQQNSKFISIDMNMEGCGAYCEPFHAHKIFLVKTGQLVNPRALFTAKGLKAFDKMNHERIQKKIKHFLKVEVRDDEQRELYQNCLGKDFKGKVDAHSEFSIRNNNFILYSGRCSNHAMRALDDLGDFENSYSFEKLEKHLTPLGKYLLENKRTKLVKSEITTGIYKGKIAGKYPIKLFISTINDDGSLSASYWYDKYKQVINLSGTYKDGKLELYVNRHNSIKKKWIAIESIVGTLKNNRFRGTWKNLEKAQEFSLNMVLN